MIRRLIAECLGSDAYAARAIQNQDMPYSVYNVVAEEKLNALRGQCDLEKIRYDINTFSDDYEECVNKSKALQTKLLAFSKFKCIVFSVSETVEDNGHTFRSRVDFTLTV